jgi:hypothetical protein
VIKAEQGASQENFMQKENILSSKVFSGDAAKKNLPGEDYKVVINVFVHGTVGVVSALVSPIKVLRGQRTEGSLFEKGTSFLRKNKRFVKKILMLEEGLQVVDVSAEEAYSGCFPWSCAPRSVAAYSSISSLFCDFREAFYCFGWSGLFNNIIRIKAAVSLFNHLIDLKKTFDFQGLVPEFRLIAHSHGGNVCLWLREVQRFMQEGFGLGSEEGSFDKEFLRVLESCPLKSDKKESDPFFYLPESCDLSIDALGMFGTPIQKQTEFLADGFFFNKVINVFSTGDIIQSSDCITASDRRWSRTQFFDKKSRGKEGRMRGAGLVCDCRIAFAEEVCNKDSLVFKYHSPNHNDFWKSIKHGRGMEFCDFLPLVVLFPAILSLVGKEGVIAGHESLVVKFFEDKKDRVVAEIFDKKNATVSLGRKEVLKKVFEKEKCDMKAFLQI